MNYSSIVIFWFDKLGDGGGSSALMFSLSIDLLAFPLVSLLVLAPVQLPMCCDGMRIEKCNYKQSKIN